MLTGTTVVRGLLAMVAVVVACSSRSIDGSAPEGEAGAPGGAGAAGTPTTDGVGGTRAGAAGDVGTATGGSAGPSGGKGGASAGGGTDAGSSGSDGIAAGGVDGGTGGSGGEPCVNDGGEGGACPVERDPTCVTDCSSLERTPAILDADGSWQCPDSAPIRAEECHIDCPALYEAVDDEENAYVCGAGTLCTPRGLYSYLKSCTEPFTQEIELDASCRCQLIPTSCPADADLTRPVCGADHETYANECEMWQARMNRPGESAWCPDDPPGYFQCEHTYCLEGVEICIGPRVIDDHHITGGSCVENACADGGGCECLVAELGAAEQFDEYSPGPVPEGYSWCSDGIEGRVILRH